MPQLQLVLLLLSNATSSVLLLLLLSLLLLYKNLEANLKYEYEKVKFINIVISMLGVFDSSSVDFLEMLEDLKFDKTCRHYVVKKIMAIAVRTSYYVFCRRNKDLDNAELMTF